MKAQRKKAIETLIAQLHKSKLAASSKLAHSMDFQPEREAVTDDASSEAQVNEELEISTQLAAKSSDQLVKICAALDKAKDGTYGICEDCQEDIAIARLTALPFAIRCLGCQEKADEA